MMADLQSLTVGVVFWFDFPILMLQLSYTRRYCYVRTYIIQSCLHQRKPHHSLISSTIP